MCALVLFSDEYFPKRYKMFVSNKRWLLRLVRQCIKLSQIKIIRTMHQCVYYFACSFCEDNSECGGKTLETSKQQVRQLLLKYRFKYKCPLKFEFNEILVRLFIYVACVTLTNFNLVVFTCSSTLIRKLFWINLSYFWFWKIEWWQGFLCESTQVRLSAEKTSIFYVCVLSNKFTQLGELIAHYSWVASLAWKIDMLVLVLYVDYSTKLWNMNSDFVFMRKKVIDWGSWLWLILTILN